MSRRNQLPSKHRRIALALMVTIASMGTPAYVLAEQPALVLNIVIDGLDGDYLELLAPHFGKGGFNRLMRHGRMYANVDFGTSLDPVAATAVLLTGASPSLNGIGSATTLDREALRMTPVLLDPQSLGNYTSETYSPRGIAVGTLADEMRIAGGGMTAAYSVATDPQQAIVLAGHAANAAIWLDAAKGNWAGSAWYKDMPPAVTRRNRTAPLDITLDTVSWTPLLRPDAYPGLPEATRRYPFRYAFPKANHARYDIFKASAIANREVTDIAGEIIRSQELGKHEGADLISVAYSLGEFDFTRSQDTRMELMDKYVRLDRDLEQLFATAEKAAGTDRVAILVAGTPRSPRSRRDDERWSMPSGEFSTRKALSLLNMYLIAAYGNGEWFNAYHNGTFYLNRRLVKERQADAKALRASAAEFLGRMAGVHRAFTQEDILAGRAGDAAMRNTPVDQIGDITVQVVPGWEVVDDFNNKSAATAGTDAPHYTERFAPATAPAFFLAPAVRAERIDATVDARAIAPTMARLLRIRSPNAAELAPLF